MQIQHDNTRAVEAATEKRENRIKEITNRGDAIVRASLVKALYRLKGDDPRKPYPAPRQKFSDTMRAASCPFRAGFDLMARMIEDGATHQDMRIFAASISIGFVDSIYADKELIPPLDVTAPRLLRETGELGAAQMVALAHPCPANYERVRDEARDVEAALGVTLIGLEAECASKFRSLR